MHFDHYMHGNPDETIGGAPLDVARALPTSALVQVLGERMAASGDVAVEVAELKEIEGLAARGAETLVERFRLQELATKVLPRVARALVYRTTKLRAAERRLAEAEELTVPTQRTPFMAAEV